MGSENSAISLSPDIVFVDAGDGSARLLNLGGSFYALNAVGAEFLRTVLQNDTATAIHLLASSRADSEEQISVDLQLLLAELNRKHLVYFKEKPSNRIQRRRLFARLLISPSLFLIRHACSSNYWRAHCLLLFSHVCFRLFGWSDTVALWGGHATGDSTAHASQVPIISDLVRKAVAGHWLAVECKERSISCWKLLQWEGIQSDLVVGVSLSPMQGHCWCSYDRTILADDAERCRLFVPIIQYNARQR